MASKKQLRRQKRQDEFQSHPPRKKLAPLEPRTRRQAQLISDLSHRQLTFVTGPAGSGKTYVAARFACQLFEQKKIDKIIVTRPMVTAEEEMGILPGDALDKFAPFFAPVREILEEDLGRSHVENLIKNRRIDIAPIGYLRGHTFKNAFVLFDEAQNTTPGQMKLFLTRIGEGAKVCVSGDLEQVDIPGVSGLKDAVDRFCGLDEVALAKFEIEDVVRSQLVQKILLGYR